VAQLVARTAGGREVAGSSPVTPTMRKLTPMKTLKLDHELAQLVRQGVKTSTWRVFDDKNISVGDEIELIDKVDPADQTTWKSVGLVKVQKVLEEPVGEITRDDFEGHELFETPEIMLKTYQKYYGSRVTVDTSVKMIHFKLND
jgi:hypothetical protein